MIVGALLGLAWAAGLRGWMVQLVGPESTFSWQGTFAALLVPGAVVGGLLGWAEHLRRSGGRPGWQWLAAAPWLLPVAALSLPGALTRLQTTGEGGGAIGMVLLASVAAVSIAVPGRLWWRIPAAVVGFAILPAAFLGEPMRPELALSTPLGMWDAITLCTLFVTLALACSIPMRRPVSGLQEPGPHQGVALVSLGALVGLSWAACLRAFMTEVAGDEAAMTWAGTFGWVLAPGVAVGALLGWAEHLRRTGGGPHWRTLALAPLLFCAVLFSQPTDLLGIFEDGVGGGAIGVPVLGMIGGYALSGRGPWWRRVACAFLALSAIPIWALTATAVGGERLALDTARGAWAAVLYWSLLAVLALASAIPHRPVSEATRQRAPAAAVSTSAP